MIKFGTDGWRAVIAEDFTFSNVRIVAQAIADYLKEGSKKKAGTLKSKSLIVGYDTRFLSNRYAEVISEVLAGNRIRVMLVDKPSPTPAVSLAIRNKGLSGGVMVTASHNPPRFNGIKFKADFAGPADSSITDRIEDLFYKSRIRSMPFDKARSSGLVREIDVVPPYIDFLRSYIEMDRLKDTRLKVLVDSMYGVADEYIAKLFNGGGATDRSTSFSQAPLEISLKPTNVAKFLTGQAERGGGPQVITIHSKADPLFGGINPEPIAKNLKELATMMEEGDFDIGLAIDGDGDRLGAVRPDGRFISPQWLISLLLLHLVEDMRWRGLVVKTINDTSLIEQIAQKHNLEVSETPVGFKYISSLMRKKEVLIGGEESGGIGFRGYIPERDGILAGLLLLEMLAYRKKSIIKIMSEVEKEFGRFCYLREDLEYRQPRGQRPFSKLKRCPPDNLLKKKVIQVKTYDGVKFICEDGSWLLFRLSGTEPLLRIYAEASSQKKVAELITIGKKMMTEFVCRKS